MIKSRCTGNSFTRISKFIFEYCSVVNRLHFIKKSLAPSAPDIWKITKNLVTEHMRHPVQSPLGLVIIKRRESKDYIFGKYIISLQSQFFGLENKVI